jgi:hypothetical protein
MYIQFLFNFCNSCKTFSSPDSEYLHVNLIFVYYGEEFIKVRIISFINPSS